MKFSRRGSLLALLMNALATIHLAWFYLRIPEALDLVTYEQGAERTPFQERVLMMLPLHWAHDSILMKRLAGAITRMPGWFPAPGNGSIHPETILEAAIDVAAIVITGLIARRLYESSSRTGLLTRLIYPLTLLMIAVTYSMPVSHPLRFIYDLPAMAFFATELYLILFRVHAFAFAALFLVATLNRETTLLLLPVYWITQAVPWRAASPLPSRDSELRLLCTRRTGPAHFVWKNLRAPETLAVVLSLGACWLSWHLWVSAHFAANPSAAAPRLSLNLGTLLCPIAWPQLFSAAAYLWPLPLLFRRSIPDATLCAWTFLPLLWLAFMLPFALLIETRVFGELIPYYAVTVSLIAEESILRSASLQTSLGQAVKR
jgi:hypothetical protein